MKIDKLWYQRNFLSHLLRPLCWLFRFIVAVRRCLYRWGFKKTTRFPVPVIIVGNLTVGGTGKTPLVAWLANKLQAEGYHPGIVSRGFHGQAQQWPQVVTRDSDPKQVGDEPVLLTCHTSCPVIVDPNRVAATAYLLKNYSCDIVISDDGLQHYALGRDIEIAVVDGKRRFGNGLCLPGGPLREPLSRLNQVDFVVCNQTSASSSIENKTYSQNWFTMQLVPGEVYNVADTAQQLSLEVCCQRQWHAVAGIGHPERFFLQLNEMGFTIQSHSFPDHYAFTQRDLEFSDNNAVIMTEKDAVKCRGFANERHWCLPVTAQLPETFLQTLLKRIANP